MKILNRAAAILLLSLIFFKPFFAAAAELPRDSCSIDEELPGVEVNIPVHRKSKGSVILIHGLNIRPSAMDELGGFMNQLGYSTYRVSLIGHLESAMFGGGKDIWLKQILGAYCQANKDRSKETILLGFSMGGSLAVNFADAFPELPINKLILFSPAVEIQGFANIVYSVLWMRHFGGSLPSLVPKEYRASSSTPFDNYKGLFDLESGAHQLQNIERMQEISTLIILDPDDNLISYRGLKSWLSYKKLNDWKVRTINQETEISFLQNHVIIDEQSAGPAAWTQIKKEIIKFVF